MNFAAAVYRHFYWKRKCEAEANRVAFPEVSIVSVGNITTGGTGKTPAVQWLARGLENDGFKAVIVGRGYGGEYSARGAIVSDGTRVLLDAKRAGDEALLHARALPSTPVVIGSDRMAAVRLAIEKFKPNVIVLDDGFQYWSLARDFDLLLLDAKCPFGNGKLLPVGRLREPQEELRRAHGVLLTRADAASESELQATINAVREYSGAPIFNARHAPVGLCDETCVESLTLGVLQGKRVAALSALAGNAAFFQSLRDLGAGVESILAARDHHLWRESQVRDFVSKSRDKSAVEAIITTQKDAVKINPDWCSPLPLWSLEIELAIEQEAELWNLVRARLKT